MYTLFWRPLSTTAWIPEGQFENIPEMMQHILDNAPARFSGQWEGHDNLRSHVQATVLSLSFI